MRQGRHVMAMAMGIMVGMGAVGVSHADSVFGHPNSHSQVGRQGTKNNVLNRALNGKPNRHRDKKVTNNTATPMPASMVAAGAKIFKADCETCHGPGGQGTLSAPRLAAPSGVWYTFHNEPTLEGYIQAHMPGNHPGKLSGVEVKNVAAYVWSISKAK
ncbi:MAG: cytochrome c [Firmicutes bacterium]|nr:cytochrome c [Bacillota bacterium]